MNKAWHVLAALVILAVPRIASGASPTDIWRPIGPPGGQVMDLALDPDDSRILYAGTSGGGVFKSVNGGVTWQAVNRGLSEYQILALAVAPGQTPGRTSVLYAGQRGVARSVDGGGTWTPIAAGLPPPPPFCGCGSLASVVALAVDPIDPDVVYAGVELRGVYKRISAAGRWFAAGTGLPSSTVQALAIDPAARATIYAGTSAGVAKSTDGGAHWTAARQGMGEVTVSRLVLDPGDPRRIFAATAAGVFVSDDRAATWTRESNGLGGAAVLSLAVDVSSPGAPVLYAGTPAGAFKSSAGGPFAAVGHGMDGIPIHALLADPEAPGKVWAGSFADRGPAVFRTANGVAWRPSDRGLYSALATSLGIDLRHPGRLYAGTHSGLFRSADGGATWPLPFKVLSGLDIRAVTVDPNATDTIYAGTDMGLLRSGDTGATWQQTTLSLPVESLLADRWHPGILYAGTSDGAFRCTSGAAACMLLPSIAGDVWELALEPGGAVFYAATSDSLWRSADQGSTLQQVVAADAAAGPFVGVAVDSRDVSRVYAVFGSKIFRSTDRGETFDAGVTLFPAVRALAVDPVDSSVYAGTFAGVLRSTDGGDTWSPWSTGLGGGEVVAFASRPRGALYAATNGGGLVFAALPHPQP
jgi:hypothetical protein